MLFRIFNLILRCFKALVGYFPDAKKFGFKTAFYMWKEFVFPGRKNKNYINAIAKYVDKFLEPLTEKYKAGEWEKNPVKKHDFAGKTPSGAMVYDDYAHNPEKIISCLAGMREVAGNRLFAVFQPHGYKPFGFMEEALFEKLESFLQSSDRFILLEPFYAGGTSSFSPHAADVCAKWRSASADPDRFMVMPDRETLKEFLQKNSAAGDVVVIMGARDNSLSYFSSSLTL